MRTDCYLNLAVYSRGVIVVHASVPTVCVTQRLYMTPPVQVESSFLGDLVYLCKPLQLSVWSSFLSLTHTHNRILAQTACAC